MSSTLYANSPTEKPINVSANVVENCNFGSTSGGTIDIVMGEYNTVGTEETSPLQTTGDFDFKCSKNADVDILMDNGDHADGANRRMHNGSGEYLTYDLYKDSAYTERWGATISDCYHYTSTSSSPEQIMIYAKIPEGQDVSVGTYTDTLTLTVSY